MFLRAMWVKCFHLTVECCLKEVSSDIWQWTLQDVYLCISGNLTLNSSVIQLYPTPCDLMDLVPQVSLSFTISQNLLKLMATESMMPSHHLILLHHLFLPSVFPTLRIFSSDSALSFMWPKFWSFSISPSNEWSGLISFRIGWFDLLPVQGTHKSLF